MGIRNRRLLARVRDRLKLITPHGDQERERVAGLAPRHRELITPHGDQEPSSSPGRTPTRASTHYPSWGSGTPVSGSHRLAANASLPLMGIRNALRRARQPPGRPLITPHGDQERSTSSTAASWTPAHYPSWGSGTKVAATHQVPLHPPHYPSWGSGTRRWFCAR